MDKILVGVFLKKLRTDRGLSMFDVEKASLGLAKKKGNDDLVLWRSRIQDIERGASPGPAKILALSRIYKVSIEKLVRLFG